MATLSSLQISDNRIDELSTQMFQLQLSSSGDSTELAPLAEPLTEFTLFPKLAAELRLKIWKLALPMPDKRFRRMIQVKGWVSTILKVSLGNSRHPSKPRPIVELSQARCSKTRAATSP